MNSLYSLKAGSRLDDRYIVMDVIGEGGFGITYLGFDERLEIKVAIKEYYPQHLVARMNNYGNEVAVTKQNLHESYEKGKKRFLEEAMILGRLESEDGIVNVKDYFEENNTAYFVMEYLDGEDFETILNRDGTMDIDTLIPLLEPVMKSLERVHLEGLIHRDISPDNIILTSHGTAKLVDFGAARDYVGGDKSQTVILKPGYAPEEQYRSDEEQGPWTDVYALAATIYRCITGIKLPESYRRVIDDSLKRPSELGTDLTSVQERALMKGLEIYARDRYQNVSEFRLALMAPEVQEYISPSKTLEGYGTRFSDEESGISPIALFGAAGLFIMLAVGAGFLFHTLRNRPSETEDQIRAANEYKLTEASTQTDSAYGKRKDSDDGEASAKGGQGTDSNDQKQYSEDEAEGNTGFGERWDESGISQDSVDANSPDEEDFDDESTAEEDPAAEDQSPESIEEDDSSNWVEQPTEADTEKQPTEGWTDPAEGTTETQPTEGLTNPAETTTETQPVEGWTDPAEGTTETQPAEGLTNPAEATTETQPVEGWTDPAEGTTETQPTEGLTNPAEATTEEQPVEGWSDPAEGTTEAQPTEGLTNPAEATTETQPAEGLTNPAEATTETQPAEGLTNPAEATTEEQPVEGWSDSAANTDTEKENVTVPAQGSEDLQEGFSESTEKKETTDGATEQAQDDTTEVSSLTDPNSSQGLIIQEEEQAAGPENPGSEMAASTEITDKGQAASTEMTDNGQAASTEITDNGQDASAATDESGQTVSTEEKKVESFVENGQAETESTEAVNDQDPGQIKSETDTVVEAAKEPEPAAEEVKEETEESEPAAEEVKEETEESEPAAEEAAEENEESEPAAEEVKEETEESEPAAEEVKEETEESEPAAEEAAEENEESESATEETEQTETVTDEALLEAGDMQETGQEDLSRQMNEIDASQTNYEEMNGYPSYILESLDTDRFQISSLIDDQGCLKKNLITDTQSGVTAEIYHNGVSQENMAGGVSLKNTAFYTRVMNPEGEECQAYFRNGKVVSFVGPDGNVQDFGEGIDYASFLDRMEQGDFGGLVKLLLDVTVPGWEA